MKFIKRPLDWFKNLKGRTKIILAIILVVVLAVVFWPRKKPELPQYQTVATSDIRESVSTSGTLTGKAVADLKFPFSGKLIYLGVAPGDSVVRGQVIAKLDATTLNSTYQTALNTRRTTQAAVDNTHDQVKDHSGDETFAQKAARTAAEAANDSAYDAVLAAQKALRDAVIYSPIAGIVADQAHATVGQNISLSDLMAQVVDFSDKEFWADVDESDIGKIEIGQKAEVTLNAYGDRVFKGTVFEIVPQAKTSSDGATVVTVKILLEDKDLKTVNGLNGQVNIITSEKHSVLTVPQNAIVGEDEIYIKRNGKPEKVKLGIGLRSDTEAEVTSGLSAGDEIVANPEVIK